MENPNILWAQDKEYIFLTINILNIKEQEIVFNENTIEIVGKNNINNFKINLDLTCNIVKEKSNWNLNNRNLKINLKKEKSVFINKLTKTKRNNIKIDWHKWINEDSSDGENDMVSNFNDFKKQLPEEVLNKDFSEFDNDIDINNIDNDVGEDENLNLDINDNKENKEEHIIEDIDTLNEDEIFDGNDASCELSSSLPNEDINMDNDMIFKPEPITELETEELDSNNIDIDEAYWPNN